MRALVRTPTASFARATRMDEGPAIDVERARVQHGAYVRALASLGVAIRHVRPDDRFPDACYVEDQAVVFDGTALVTRSGHPGRQGEADAIEVALGDLGVRTRRMVGPATLDGGDVLRLGRRLYVGRSARTSEAGVEALRAAFPAAEVVPVELPETVLHLKCVCSSPAEGVLVLADDTIDPAVFTGAYERLVRVPAEERWAANTVGVGGRVLVGAGYPEAATALWAAGLEPVEVEVDELAKGDGSLTCLSVLLP